MIREVPHAIGLGHAYLVVFFEAPHDRVYIKAFFVDFPIMLAVKYIYLRA